MDINELPAPSFITNISRGGAFIETPVPFELGDPVTFAVQLPGDDRKRLVFGRVRWLRETEPRGIGMKFEHHMIQKEVLDFITRCTAKKL